MHNVSAQKDSASVVIPPFKIKWVKSSTTPLPPPHHDSPRSTNNKKKISKGSKKAAPDILAQCNTINDTAKLFWNFTG